jgi:hypothetical protein
LLWFENIQNELPPGATVLAATLYLTATAANPTPGEFQLHRLLAAWGEGIGSGTSGNPATLGDATWNSRLHDVSPWTAPGGVAGNDLITASSSAVLVGGSGEYAFTGLASDVQFMLDDIGMNYGWMLRRDIEDAPQTARQFLAFEFGLDSAPRLEIEYVPEPEAPILVITGVALIWRCSRHRRIVGRRS